MAKIEHWQWHGQVASAHGGRLWRQIMGRQIMADYGATHIRLRQIMGPPILDLTQF